MLQGNDVVHCVPTSTQVPHTILKCSLHAQMIQPYEMNVESTSY